MHSHFTYITEKNKAALRVTLFVCTVSCVCVIVSDLKNNHDRELKDFPSYVCCNYFFFSRYRLSLYITEVTLQREPSIFRSSISRGTFDFIAAVKHCMHALSTAMKEQKVKCLFALQKLSFITIHHHTWCLSTCSESDMWSGALNITCGGELTQWGHL